MISRIQPLQTTDLSVLPMQIVYSSRYGAQNIEHIGSAHGHAELKILRCGHPAASGRRAKTSWTFGLEHTESAKQNAGWSVAGWDVLRSDPIH